MTDKTLTDALSANYMRADLTIRNWGGTKTDREAAREFLAQKGAAEDAATLTKNLLKGADDEFKETNSAYTRIRTWFYANTIDMGGIYAVSVTNVMPFLTEFAKLKQEAEEKRQAFIDCFDNAVKRAAVSAGGLYNPADYPAKSELSRRFDAELNVRPMPAIQDFDRLTLPARLTEGLKGLYERQAQRHMEAAVEDVQGKLLEYVERMVVQLTKVADGKGTRLYTSLTGNIRQTLSLVRGLQAIDGGQLSALADDIEAKLLTYEVDAYKGNAPLARKVAEDARGIYTRITNPQQVEETNDAIVHEVTTTNDDSDFDPESVYY